MNSTKIITEILHSISSVYTQKKKKKEILNFMKFKQLDEESNAKKK